jgi:Protein of unknown function (DUF4232)
MGPLPRPTRLFVLAVASALLSACGRYAVAPTVHPAATNASDIVPWINRAAAAYVAPVATPYPTSASPCTTAHLKIGPSTTGAGMSQSFLQVALINTGASTCLLKGQPRVSGVNAAGIRVVPSAQPGPTFVGGMVPADIAPGAHGYLALGTASACGGVEQLQHTTYRQLTFIMPDGGTFATDLTFSVGSCGLTVDQLGLLNTDEAEPSPGPLAVLSASVNARLSVKAGTVLRYVVTLSNGTTAPVELRPCPSYTEWTSALMTAASKEPPTFSYQLNCSVSAIAPGGSVKFAMELAIPRTAVVGVSKFGWYLNEPGGPYAGGALNVEP